jgi:DUF917 family protein
MRHCALSGIAAEVTPPDAPRAFPNDAMNTIAMQKCPAPPALGADASDSMSTTDSKSWRVSSR